MATRTPVTLLAATLLATTWALPGASLAQTPDDCIPLTTELGCLEVAPDSARVDLQQPVFSDPTNVTNPFFPISNLDSVILLGHVDGKPFRTETTLLPDTRVIEWNGQKIETRTSQYTAYLDGRIEEIALDWYAQADDGSVWYFGEDVVDYEDGVVISTEGTWLAGRNGPAAMIMPADPQVGQVYRTETIPSIAFEEVTIKAVDQPMHGPHGPVEGAIIVSELHQDGTTEDKVFAPGYGEFRTGDGGDLEALALAVPADARGEPLPADLDTLSTGSADLFDAIQAEDWDAASATLETMTSAWDTYRAGDVPPMIAARLSTSLAELIGAVDSRSAAEASQRAIDVSQNIADLRLLYLPSTEVNRARLGLWAQQVLVDTAAEDAGGVMSDVVTLELIRDRVVDGFDAATAKQVDTMLTDLRTAAEGEDFSAATDTAAQLRDFVAAL
jgi:hypothetical protein